jgi:hypothetical protein
MAVSGSCADRVRRGRGAFRAEQASKPPLRRREKRPVRVFTCPRRKGAVPFFVPCPQRWPNSGLEISAGCARTDSWSQDAPAPPGELDGARPAFRGSRYPAAESIRPPPCALLFGKSDRTSIDSARSGRGRNAARRRFARRDSPPMGLRGKAVGGDSVGDSSARRCSVADGVASYRCSVAGGGDSYRTSDWTGYSCAGPDRGPEGPNDAKGWHTSGPRRKRLGWGKGGTPRDAAQA